MTSLRMDVEDPQRPCLGLRDTVKSEQGPVNERSLTYGIEEAACASAELKNRMHAY